MAALIVAIALLASQSLAQTKAITETGKSVVLNDDGTWSYETEPHTKSSGGFRGGKWGMSKSEVKALENGQSIQEDEEALIYQGQVAGLSCYYGYVFVQDKLVRGKYVVNETHTNKNDHIIDYQSLQKLLTEKYGEPVEDETLWRNDLYKDDPEDYGMAICVGHLLYWTEWNAPGTKVSLILTGENYDVSLQIEYTSTELAQLENADKKDKSLKDL